MQVDPKIAAWITVIFLILTGIVGGTAVIPGLDSALMATVRSWASFALFLLGCVNLVFHLYSAPAAGPMVKQ